MSRAAWYPRANRTAQNFQPSLGRPAMRTVNVLVLHTTEGSSWPGYEGGRQAPTFTINCTSGKAQIRQHFPLPCAAMALVQPSGSLSTNRNNAAQVELVGTGGWATSANRNRPYTVSGPHTNWANPDQMMLRAVADLIAWLHKEWEVPLNAPIPFDNWAGNNTHRMTASQWAGFTGICGHSHVWGNEHTDPGKFPIAACLKLAAGGTINQEDDVISDKDIQRIAAAVHSQKIGRTGVSFGVLGEKLLKGQIQTGLVESGMQRIWKMLLQIDRGGIITWNVRKIAAKLGGSK